MALAALHQRGPSPEGFCRFVRSRLSQDVHGDVAEEAENCERDGSERYHGVHERTLVSRARIAAPRSVRTIRSL